MLQTTNNVFNTSLYKYVIPQSLLAWQRVRIANMMAHTGKEWVDIVARQNSGSFLLLLLLLFLLLLGKEFKNKIKLLVIEFQHLVQKFVSGANYDSVFLFLLYSRE